MALSAERAAERRRLLLECPSRAPSWTEEDELPAGLAGELQVRRRLGLSDDPALVARLHEQPDQAASGAWDYMRVLLTAEEERELGDREAAVYDAVELIREYLETLPPEHTGTLRVDPPRAEVVVQVTERADRAATQAEVERLAGAAVTVLIEVVRYSAAQLQDIADRIADLPGLQWSGIGSGSDGCVEVMVPGDVNEAERLIATIAEPCSYRVIEGTVTHGG